MIQRELLSRIARAIKASLTHKRYWRSERAFQAEFYCNLKDNVLELYPDAILESEYQKTLNFHKLRRRPDLIIHKPTEVSQNSERAKDNFVIIQIKTNATLRKAIADFYKINEIINTLEYPVGILINVDSSGQTFLQSYSGDHKDKIHELSVYKDGRMIKIKHAFFTDHKLKMETIS